MSVHTQYQNQTANILPVVWGISCHCYMLWYGCVELQLQWVGCYMCGWVFVNRHMVMTYDLVVLKAWLIRWGPWCCNAGPSTSQAPKPKDGWRYHVLSNIDGVHCVVVRGRKKKNVSDLASPLEVGDNRNNLIGNSLWMNGLHCQKP